MPKKRMQSEFGFQTRTSAFPVREKSFDLSPETWRMIHLAKVAEFVNDNIVEQLRGICEEKRIDDDTGTEGTTSPPGAQQFELESCRDRKIHLLCKFKDARFEFQFGGANQQKFESACDGRKM